MSDIIEAVYKDGVIKLKKRLREGEKVIVIVKPREKGSDDTSEFSEVNL